MRINKENLRFRTSAECPNSFKRGLANVKVISLRIIYLILHCEWITDKKLSRRVKKLPDEVIPATISVRGGNGFENLFKKMPPELFEKVIFYFNYEDMRNVEKVNLFCFQRVTSYSIRQFFNFLYHEIKEEWGQDQREQLEKLEDSLHEANALDINKKMLILKEEIAEVLQDLPDNRIKDLQNSFATKQIVLPRFFDGIFTEAEVLKETHRVYNDKSLEDKPFSQLAPGFYREEKLCEIACGLILENYNQKSPHQPYRYRDILDADIEKALMIARKLSLEIFQGRIIKYVVQLLIRGERNVDALACYKPWLERVPYIQNEIINAFARNGDIESVLKIFDAVLKKDYENNLKNQLLCSCATVFIRAQHTEHALTILKKLTEQKHHEIFILNILFDLAISSNMVNSHTFFDEIKSPQKETILKSLIQKLTNACEWDQAIAFAQKISSNEEREASIKSIEAQRMHH
ncbi:hypothetical protein PHSC3_001806 [Chlamydiales bacterium STE3]|nr:hypothetical protein PHSC3_001806 [Chlamydiales bacterium STE3]